MGDLCLNSLDYSQIAPVIYIYIYIYIYYIYKIDIYNIDIYNINIYNIDIYNIDIYLYTYIPKPTNLTTNQNRIKE